MIELTENYVTKDAEKIAQSILKDIESTQLRKFYDDFKVIERRIKEQQDLTDEKFKKEILPHIKFVGTKIVYSAGRSKGEGGGQKNALVPEEFKKHILNELEKIQKVSDFRNFLMHYQAIIAYFKYEEFKGKQQSNSPSKGEQRKDEREMHNKSIQSSQRMTQSPFKDKFQKK